MNRDDGIELPGCLIKAVHATIVPVREVGCTTIPARVVGGTDVPAGAVVGTGSGTVQCHTTHCPVICSTI